MKAYNIYSSIALKHVCQSENHFTWHTFIAKRAAIWDNRGSPLSVSKKVSGNPGVLLQASAPCHGGSKVCSGP